MEGNMLTLLLVASAIGLALSNPLVNRNDDDIPQCFQPPASGMCLAYFPSYYYNPSKETCETFIYGGCQGNANRFFSFSECMNKCGGFKQEPNDSFKLVLENGEDQNPTESEPQVEDICSLSSEMGPCRALMPRFYFNGDKCESFIYGGCEGNGNNFKTVEECHQKCGSASSEEVATVDSNESEQASDEAVAEGASEESADKSDSKSEN